MPRKYAEDIVDRFLEVAQQGHLPPAIRAKTLWGLAYAMTPSERLEAQRQLMQIYDAKIVYWQEKGAPQAIVDLWQAKKSKKNVAIQALLKASGG